MVKYIIAEGGIFKMNSYKILTAFFILNKFTLTLVWYIFNYYNSFFIKDFICFCLKSRWRKIIYLNWYVFKRLKYREKLKMRNSQFAIFCFSLFHISIFCDKGYSIGKGSKNRQPIHLGVQSLSQRIMRYGSFTIIA